ncbi:MAG: hypothetical protein HDQ99_19950 [Lachnospiraceae bacterium]|nr:hypothetical protein [Lachnospiraceae bacterium]
MDAINELLNINFSYVLLSVFVILIGIKAIVSIFEWVIEKLGLETKWMRKRREEHDLLIQTSQNLTALQKQHTHDVEESDAHDEDIKAELSAFMSEIKTSISETQSELKQFAENRVHDREQSFKIQKELTDSQNNLAESLSSISKKIDKMQHITELRFKESEEKNNKRIRAELKDKISQSYRYYHELRKINDMELEALEDLIEEYEEADGKNSFVHSVVQKEMYTWEKIDRNKDVS